MVPGACSSISPLSSRRASRNIHSNTLPPVSPPAAHNPGTPMAIPDSKRPPPIDTSTTETGPQDAIAMTKTTSWEAGRGPDGDSQAHAPGGPDLRTSSRQIPSATEGMMASPHAAGCHDAGLDALGSILTRGSFLPGTVKVPKSVQARVSADISQTCKSPNVQQISVNRSVQRGANPWNTRTPGSSNVFFSARPRPRIFCRLMLQRVLCLQGHRIFLFNRTLGVTTPSVTGSAPLRFFIASRGSKKFPAPQAISRYDKDRLNLLMWVYVVFPIMLNDIFKSFNPIEEDGLQSF
jgi:hypothetical protein